MANEPINLINELNSRFSAPREKIEIRIGVEDKSQITVDSESGIVVVSKSRNPSPYANNIEYTERYATSAIESHGIRNTDLPAPTKISRNKAENRISSIEDRLGIFLYNLIPYQTINSLSDIGNSIDGVGDAVFAIKNLIGDALDGLSKLKYFTPGELILTLGHNFYTVSLTRGITIKKGKKGISGVALPSDVWTGQPDIFYGRDEDRNSLRELGSKLISRIIEAGRDKLDDNANEHFAQEKKHITPKYEFGPSTIKVIKKRDFFNQLSDTNPKETTERYNLFHSLIRRQVKDLTKWAKYLNTQSFDLKEQKNRKHETDEDEYLINPDVLKVTQRVQVWDENENWKDDTESFHSDLVESRRLNTYSGYKINKNVDEIIQRVNTKDGTIWNKQATDNPTTEEFGTREDVETNRNHETNADEYLINPDVLKITQRVNTKDGTIWNKQATDNPTTEEFGTREDVKTNRQHETDSSEYLINPDVLKVTQRVNTKDGVTWNRDEIDNPTTQEFSYRDLISKDIMDLKKDTIGIASASRIELMINPAGRYEDDNLMQGTPEDRLKEKTFIKDSEGRWQIGAIRVIPVAAENYKLDLPSFYIPFEFNPDISENSVEARYTQTQILSRIGDLQSYTGTGSLSVSITCKYFAVSHDGGNGKGDVTGNNWMGEFTLEKIQAIELGYRSLVYPHFPNASNINQGYKYVKPPLVKVIIGNHTDKNAPYASILTYQNDTVVENRLKSAINYGGNVLRTFVATSVTIKKNLNETPIYIDKHRRLRDTFGFEVSLNLIEVAPNYIDSMPDYKNYFNQYNSISWNNSYIGNQPTTAQQQDISTTTPATETGGFTR